MNTKHTFAILAACALLFSPSLSLVNGSSGDYGLRETASEAKLDVNTNVSQYIGGIIGGLLSMIAVIFFLIIVYGGFRWMTAHGEPDQVKTAQETLIAGIIGLIIALSSFAITSIVFPPAAQEGSDPRLDIIVECNAQCDASPQGVERRTCVEECIDAVEDQLIGD